MPEYKYLPIEQLIEPPSPIRATMDEAALTSLCESIKEIGVLQPLLVVPVFSWMCAKCGKAMQIAEGAKEPLCDCDPPDLKYSEMARPGRSVAAPVAYEIIAGHRRYKACIMANLNAIPCLVFADAEIARHAAMLQENTEREDITPAEEAIFFAELIQRFDYTEAQLLKAVKKSSFYVYSRLELLRGNPEVFAALRERKINMAVATQLNRCKDEKNSSYLLALAVQGGATAVTVGKWVNECNGTAESGAETAKVESTWPVGTTQAVSDERVCIFCGRGHQPLNLVPVWVHDWELRDWKERLENAAVVDLEPNKSAQGA